MRDERPGDGARTMWLSQPTGISKMTSKLIERRSRELRAKTRRKLIGTVAGPFAASMFYAYGMKEFYALRQVVQLPFAIALAWSVIGLFFLNRGMWSAMMPADTGLRTGLEFCRNEVERQRDLVRRVVLWSFGPVMLATGTLVLALALVSTRERGIFPDGLPFITLVIVWIVSWFVIRLREQRELQHEIEELKGMQMENHD
ncbi:MAG: hypothetical protein JWN34_313 [Bryobacterales bacterium]|jgi:hypothetical protein|nr:hypothetical protein [Bryobacterales bacterium]